MLSWPGWLTADTLPHQPKLSVIEPIVWREKIESLLAASVRVVFFFNPLLSALSKKLFFFCSIAITVGVDPWVD